MWFIGEVIRTVIFGGLGMFIGGPIGGIIGVFVAYATQQPPRKNYKYNFECPKCDSVNGVDSYGRYNCYNCKETLDVSRNGVSAVGISATCPFCFEDNIIQHEGKWSCHSCSKVFTYRNGRVLREEETFLFLIMALFGKISKVDGVVVKEQIDLVDKFLVNTLELDSETRKLAIKYFNQVKDNNVSFQSYCQIFKENINEDDVFEDKYATLLDTVKYLYKLASINNRVTFQASDYLNCAVGVFGITSDDYNSIKDEFGNEADDKYYRILGCKKGDSMDAIKGQYRKLVKEYHPDKVNNMQISETVKETLIEKFKEVQEAYEKIKEVEMI